MLIFHMGTFMGFFFSFSPLHLEAASYEHLQNYPITLKKQQVYCYQGIANIGSIILFFPYIPPDVLQYLTLKLYACWGQLPSFYSKFALHLTQQDPWPMHGASRH